MRPWAEDQQRSKARGKWTGNSSTRARENARQGRKEPRRPDRGWDGSNEEGSHCKKHKHTCDMCRLGAGVIVLIGISVAAKYWLQACGGGCLGVLHGVAATLADSVCRPCSPAAQFCRKLALIPAAQRQCGVRRSPRVQVRIRVRLCCGCRCTGAGAVEVRLSLGVAYCKIY